MVLFDDEAQAVCEGEFARFGPRRRGERKREENEDGLTGNHCGEC
jgi:hypothetical protein